ncbi:MAG: malectin domain-containing carbohydrate-binding protein, partial [Capsulimonas sp.]|uniref:malectin domain-containing carbohydrate-binding protein n=1 Tax=Capsulimonas sp. TaxID=2494211 RepID=UPI003267BB96
MLKYFTSTALSVLLISQCSLALAAQSPSVTAVPNSGWRLLLDPQASWRDDKLYLPDEVKLETLPINAPTGGWGVLSAGAGLGVSLPGTVEEHYWGKAPGHVLNPADINQVVNADGAYFGVSWWYRTFTAPKLAPGERLVFSFPGARMRAEVYVNGKLVGYDVVTETAFEADATRALKSGGPNTIAVRITNPGGNFAWVDFDLLKWGSYELPVSHGFGGMDGGVTMSVRGPVAVTDLAMLNNPDPRKITFTAQVISHGPAYDGPVALSIQKGGKILWSGAAPVHVGAGGSATVTKSVTLPGAQLWSVGKPNLYTGAASIPAISHSDHATDFGFRWFTAKGVGSDAKLYLNGKRIVVKSSISWGFWSPNGMFPDQAAADREVAAAHAIGLNAVQNHRHMPKPIILDTFDRAGLMRYCEAGAGGFTYRWDNEPNYPNTGPVDTSGAGGEPTTFYNKYELCKVLAMIKAERSHPSEIIWSLQNEASVNLRNPKIYYTLRKMREADPSRIIMLESGFSSHDQVWAPPYSSDLQIDKGQGSGWNDRHTAGDAPGSVYLDSYYKSATDYKYGPDSKAEISAWGEMATGASPDDHAAISAWYKAQGIPGYDRAAHEAIDAAYEKFLDAYGFRSAFPHADAIFHGAAAKHYDNTARMLENGRINNWNDYLVLSGWESTAIDNHSGIVDARRMTKTDPAPIHAAAAPALLVIRTPHLVLAAGETANVDIHLVNEIDLKGRYTLKIVAEDAQGKTFFTSSSPVAVAGGETFGQLLKSGVAVKPAGQGIVTITASLISPSGKSILKKTEKLLVVETQPAPLYGSVAVLGSPQIGPALQKRLGLTAVPYSSSLGKVDTIVIDPSAPGETLRWQSTQVDRNTIRDAADPGLYTDQMYGRMGPVVHYPDVAAGPARVDLYFAETYFNKPGQRIFDVALNGKTVLHDLDIFQETGGSGVSLVKTFTVDIAGDGLNVSIPAVRTDNASIAAIRVTDSQGRVIREVFRRSRYFDSQGNKWNAIGATGYDWATLPTDLIQRVRDGARLIVLSNDAECADAQSAAETLGSAHVLTYSGMVGSSGPSWLGLWYFGKSHWLLNGLPSNCVLGWPYQITNGNGMKITAPGMDAVIGYGMHHSPDIGLGVAVVPCGKGQVVLFCLPGLAQAFASDNADGIDPIAARRLVYNALAGSGAAKITEEKAMTFENETKLSDFHGYQCHEFTLDGREARVVEPKHELPGRPWIWRTMFWDAFPNADIAMLERGFHVAYIDTGDTYANAKALTQFDALYNLLTNQYGFSQRPALEGLSRGGFCAYRWAYFNPDKVGCIYGDAPLCDINAARGANDFWKSILGAYQATDDEMKTLKGNPIDSLATLAAAHIPILHVCGDQDEAAILAKNNNIIQERYPALGGQFTLILKEGCMHHPHGLTDPTLVA